MPDPAYVARLEEALRECARLSGADLSGGFPTRPELPEYAVQEVKQLRDDYDEACERAFDDSQVESRTKGGMAM